MHKEVAFWHKKGAINSPFFNINLNPDYSLIETLVDTRIPSTTAA